MVTLLALSVLSFFIGSSLLVVTDPTESNYVLTAKEMLLSGDYMSPRIYGNYWYDKPIMFYWELIAAFKVFGFTDFAARFFPAFFATVSVALAAFFGTRLYNLTIGLISAVILATSAGFWYLSHAIITDMTLFASMSATLISFYFGYSEHKPNYYYISYAAAGVAVLTKGPIGFLLPGLIIFLFLIWQKDLAHMLKMKLLSGMALFLVIISTWYLPMFINHGWDFINNFFGVHNYLRATVSEHPKQNVWYYYLMVFFVGFIPWIFPVIYSKFKEFRKFRRLQIPTLDTRLKFLLTWAVTVFAVFQCFATKYPTYTFPYMMPIAIMLALFFVHREDFFKRLAAGTLVFYTFILLPVAIPICQERSGKSLAQEVTPIVQDGDIVVTYRQDYSTSLCFYSDLKVYRLETRKNIKSMLPDDLSWKSKNVMPFMAFEDVPTDKRMVAIVDEKGNQIFLDLTPGNWRLVKKLDNNLRIYVKDPVSFNSKDIWSQAIRNGGTGNNPRSIPH